MNEFNPAKKDAVRADAIRRQYVERKTTKMGELEALHDKVKLPGMIVSCIVGVLGGLVMGAGMANVMAWGNMETGLVLGIPGMILALLAYPIYKGITGSRKKKYAQQIMMLSEEIIGEEQGR